VLYVHCHGGHGRTGVVVAYLLARLLGLSAPEALRLTQLYHQTREIRGMLASPQTQAQRMQVHRLLQLDCEHADDLHVLDATGVDPVAIEAARVAQREAKAQLASLPPTPRGFAHMGGAASAGWFHPTQRRRGSSVENTESGISGAVPLTPRGRSRGFWN
jgi:hypothetical protein